MKVRLMLMKKICNNCETYFGVAVYRYLVIKETPEIQYSGQAIKFKDEIHLCDPCSEGYLSKLGEILCSR